MKIKKIFSKKRMVYGGILLAVIILSSYFLFFRTKQHKETMVVHPADFIQQVSASGKVVARENLALSFESPGMVSGVYVKVGDTVNAGQLLVNQNTGELNAQLSEMQAGIDLQKAKLAQLLAGSSPEDIKTAEDGVRAAQQNLSNSYASSLSTLSGTYTIAYSSFTLVSYIQNTYFSSTDQQEIRIQDNKNIILDRVADVKNYLDRAKTSLTNDDIDAALSHVAADLNTIYDSLVVVRQQCEEGVYYLKVSSADKASLDTQKTSVTTAIGNVTTAKTAIASYKVALVQAQDALILKKTPARPSDVAVFEAQIAQAKASAENVVAQLNKKRIYAPMRGVITAVNAKVGSVFSSNDTAVSINSLHNFQIESYVPEINISLIKISNPVNVTLDAYGPDTVFAASVVSIDPAETIKDGVSTYKVTLEFSSNDDRVKSGMTGTIIITTEKKSNVISVPQGVVTTRDGQKFVNIKEQDKVVQRKIETGSISSSGNVEVISGLSDGDIIILKNGQ